MPASIDQIRSSVQSYVAAWNEPDPVRRNELLERACADELRVVAPREMVHGRAELAALIDGFHRRRPGDRGKLTSAVEIHNGVFRFSALISGSSAAPPVEMIDVGECNDDGRIRLIFSFVGVAPPPLR